MKILKYLGIGLLVCGVLFAAAYFIKTNSKSIIEYETQTPKIVSIEREAVVTGKVIPEDEVEIKPQISGIIAELFVEEGDLVNNGDLLAKIKHEIRLQKIKEIEVGKRVSVSEKEIMVLVDE